MSQMLAALGVVLGAIVLLRVALRRLGLAPGGGTGRLRVIESCALGPRQRLHVVEVEGERLLLGATDAHLTLLRRLRPAATTEEVPVRAEAAPRAGRRTGRAVGATLAALAGVFLATAAAAEPSSSASLAPLGLDLAAAAEPERIATTLEILTLLTLLSVAPSILLMATCFTRIIIVLALLRQAIGINQLPPNQVLAGLALFLTFFVMAPVARTIQSDAIEPYVAREIDAPTASERALGPVRDFLTTHVREKDLELFISVAEIDPMTTVDAVPLSLLLPSYMISELRTAFEIGFMVFLPFLVIDLVIASMLISMGMIVLPPIVISLPFKLMLFVLLDGWNLVVGSLVTGLR